MKMSKHIEGMAPLGEELEKMIYTLAVTFCQQVYGLNPHLPIMGGNTTVENRIKTGNGEAISWLGLYFEEGCYNRESLLSVVAALHLIFPELWQDDFGVLASWYLDTTGRQTPFRDAVEGFRQLYPHCEALDYVFSEAQTKVTMENYGGVEPPKPSTREEVAVVRDVSKEAKTTPASTIEDPFSKHDRRHGLLYLRDPSSGEEVVMEM